MKRTRKAITILLSAAMLAAAVPASAAEISLQIGNNTATVDGKETTLDSAPVIINDITLVPIRFVSENLGYEVDWDQATQTVEISGNDNSIEDF